MNQSTGLLFETGGAERKGNERPLLRVLENKPIPLRKHGSGNGAKRNYDN